MLTKKVLLGYIYDLGKRLTMLEKDNLNVRVTKLEAEHKNTKNINGVSRRRGRPRKESKAAK